MVGGFIVADLPDQPHRAGQAHPLATALVSLRGDARHQRLAEGKLGEAGKLAIVAVPIQVRYFLQFGEG